MVMGGGGTSLPSNTLFFDPRSAVSSPPSAHQIQRPASVRRFM
jgi:hypothetical protein